MNQKTEYNPNRHYIVATSTGYKLVDKDTFKVVNHVATEQEIKEHEQKNKKEKGDK